MNPKIFTTIGSVLIVVGVVLVILHFTGDMSLSNAAAGAGAAFSSGGGALAAGRYKNTRCKNTQ